MVRLFLARTRPDALTPADESVPDVHGLDHVVLPVGLVVRESA